MLLNLTSNKRAGLQTSRQGFSAPCSPRWQTSSRLCFWSTRTSYSRSLNCATGSLACRSTVAPQELSNPLGCSLRLGSPTDLDRSSVESLYRKVRRVQRFLWYRCSSTGTLTLSWYCRSVGQAILQLPTPGGASKAASMFQFCSRVMASLLGLQEQPVTLPTTLKSVTL